jgi:hypothetical protein
MKKMMLFAGCMAVSAHGMSNHDEKRLIELFRICSKKERVPSIITTETRVYGTHTQMTREMRYAELHREDEAICRVVREKVGKFVAGIGGAQK